MQFSQETHSSVAMKYSFIFGVYPWRSLHDMDILIVLGTMSRSNVQGKVFWGCLEVVIFFRLAKESSKST